ncbi:3-keto-5-aminohexanoate cleavage protein [Actinomadura rayongensis]|uniref:3-keto-5-aminohexanoate cleavage protein n=1 Tax=Actinomadura rayongensis TaxID=1429076 RepID=A0A6I4WKV0_9ACTN|nr:3-keto-5-aminohexanoate cleavage protein [Actinomadura rayongensis]MXQ67544.1 3-keto-5-aminohexanoate cleavage protein [Actinomadura rayongensis]
MRQSQAMIVSCALTGAVHTPSMSDALPYTPDDIVQQGLEAVAAGASILHVHARDPETGAPTPRAEVFAEFLPQLAASGAVINITTGGSTRMSWEERVAAALRFEPELASLNLGSMNFVFSGAAKKRRSWRFDWERDYLLGSEDVIFANTFTQIERTLRTLGEERGVRFEFECYDVGHLYTLAHFLERGLVRPPLLIQCVLGVLGGIGADPANLLHMVTIADKLFGDDHDLSAFAAGRHQMPTATQIAALGGHVRVGLEDSLYIGPGRLAASNAEQVTAIVSTARGLGRTIATPEQARAMLQLKGSTAIG